MKSFLDDSERNFCYGGGPVQIFAEGSKWSPSFQYERLLAFRIRNYISSFNAVPTANALMSRALYERLGGFDSSAFSGGDMDFGLRARSIGVSCQFLDNCRVLHPARTFSSLIYKQRRVRQGKIQRVTESKQVSSPHEAMSSKSFRERMMTTFPGLMRVVIKSRRAIKGGPYGVLCVFGISVFLEVDSFLGKVFGAKKELR